MANPHKPNAHDYEAESLLMHAGGRPGKIEIIASKPMHTQHDLALAYSPGVAGPCRAIHANPEAAYDYTSKGNLVAVISNGTAVLGLGDLGALAGKPVMEGKAVLFKRFADVDCIDLEVDTRDVEEFINCVSFLGPSFGGIILEDIKAPECFIIEQRLRDMMDIPVFHDDQHGTAIITAAGLINALDLTGRDIKTARVVVNGAGAAAIACTNLVESVGIRPENVIMCDTKGTLYTGRTEGMNQWKAAHAVDTKARTLAEALVGADVFLGLSIKGAVTAEMVATMAPKPIIFAMANPDPEITPAEVKSVRPDAIIATGRSDYPNQVNNVLGFPYIFRGALDVRARTINEDMKVAAAYAIAKLAREDVPDEVAAAYSGRRLRYGPEYIIPVPFDPRLVTAISSSVAQAAMDSGVARKPIADMAVYKRQLSARLDPTAASLQGIYGTVAQQPQRVVFAEGEEERSIRAAIAFRNAGLGNPVLVGREGVVRDVLRKLGMDKAGDLEICNAKLSRNTKRYTEQLYARLQRKGVLQRDCQRRINQNRNIFGAMMVANGDADVMVTGLTRSYHHSFEEICQVIDPSPNEIVFGLSIVLVRGRTVLLADTVVNEHPNADQLAHIAAQSAAMARRMGHEPRIAFLSHATFGNPLTALNDQVRAAMALLDAQAPNFEFDGEMAPDVALDADLLGHYPFCRLSAPANVLVMPTLRSASIAAKLVQKLGGATVMGPILMGLAHEAQIVAMNATVSDIVNMAVMGSYEVIKARRDAPPSDLQQGLDVAGRRNLAGTAV